MKFKKIIFYILLLVIVNALTNYNFFLRVLYQDKESIYKVEDIKVDGSVYEIEDIQKDVSTIEIVFEEIPNEFYIEFTNKDFENYVHFNPHYYQDDIRSNNLYVYSSVNEKIDNLKFIVYGGSISKITINPSFKYQLNIIKTLTIYAIVLLLFHIFKTNKKLDLKDKKQSILTIMTFVVLFTMSTIWCFNYSKNEQYDLYNQYTDSIINGTLELDYPLSRGIANSLNPYDTSNRGYSYLFDATYYNGNYYCYFGIWPNLVLQVPYKIITGTYLNHSAATLIYVILSFISTFLLFKKIVEKYFKNISYRTFIMSFIFIIFGSKLLWCIRRPSFYELVTVAAYFHATMGLYLVLFNKNNIVRDLLGYLSLAVCVLCRPTTLLVSVLIIPKLIKRIKEKEFKLIDLLVLIMPYLIIGLFTMCINYIRFGSIFEFGISYQLTTNNLSNNTFSLLKSLCGCFYYLFGMYNIQLLPFKISSTSNAFPIIADFHLENFGGGVISTSIIGIILFFTPLIIKKVKEKELKIYIVFSIILGFVLMFISSGIGALVGRYMTDFNYLLYFASVIMCLYVMKLDKSSTLRKIYLVLITISIFINYFLILTNY